MTSYKCCHTKFVHYVCVKCYGIYHKSCLPKFRNKVQLTEENKLICCEDLNTKNDYDEEKENLEKTVSELVEDGEIKNSYIEKLKTDNNVFLQEALKREDEMNEIIQKQEDTIQELKERINKMTPLVQSNDEIKSTSSTQTNIKRTKNSFTSMDMEQPNNIVPENPQESEIKNKANEVEIIYLKKLLNQNDLLIHSLRDQTTSLKEHIILINKYTEISTSPTNKRLEFDTAFNTCKQVIGDTVKHDFVSQAKTNSTVQKNCSLSKPTNHITPRKITQEEVSKAIDNAKLSTITMVKETSCARNKNKTIHSKIVGVNTATQNLAAEHKHWLFVSKYKKTYQKETLEQYLQEKFPDNSFIIEQIPNQGSFNSFKVGVDDSIKHAVLKPNVWPSGIEVSDYIFRRKPYAQYANFRKRQSYWRPYYKPKYSQHSK